MAVTVITYGTFDLFHVGHVRLLERLRALGDRLVVGVSTDEFNATKGKKTVIPFDQRVEILSAIKHVDEVFAERDWSQKREDIRRYQANIFAMGDDWAGRFDELSDQVNVVYLPRTTGISTTDLKALITTLEREKVDAVRHALSNVSRLLDDLG